MLICRRVNVATLSELCFLICILNGQLSVDYIQEGFDAVSADGVVLAARMNGGNVICEICAHCRGTQNCGVAVSYPGIAFFTMPSGSKMT